MNIQERIEALETEFNEKIKVLKAEVQREEEFPEYGDDYWFLLSGGTIYDNFYTNSHVDNKRLEIGNFFQTEQQAEFSVEKLKVEAELRKFSKAFKRDTLNFIMCFDTDEDKICRETKRLMVQGAFYFENIYQLDKAIESVGEERIKKYIFGVED